MSGTRFRSLPPAAARLLLALLILVALGGAMGGGASGSLRLDGSDPLRTDLALYAAVAHRVGDGQNYYPAVVAEQRARNYPLRPFVTVRLPTLALLVGNLGERGASLLLRLLALVAMAALVVRLRGSVRPILLWLPTAALAASAIALLTVPAMTFWHESWAALLMVLSLSCRSRAHWAWSVFLGLLATLFRELALPYLCLMCVLAFLERSRAEAAAWGGAILVFAAALTAHAATLSSYVTAADQHSQGWSGIGGWPFVLSMLQHVSLFLFLPLPLLACVVPLALVGWAGLKGETGARAALLLSGYSAAFMLIGRPDNFYWGIMIAPILPAGLALAVPAMRDLLRASAPRVREPVTLSAA